MYETRESSALRLQMVEHIHRCLRFRPFLSRALMFFHGNSEGRNQLTEGHVAHGTTHAPITDAPITRASTHPISDAVGPGHTKRTKEQQRDIQAMRDERRRTAERHHKHSPNCLQNPLPCISICPCPAPPPHPPPFRAQRKRVHL